MKEIVWFRGDLRLKDNPALRAAAEGEGGILPLYILEEPALTPRGGASCWWLHHSLAALNRELGGALILKRGPAKQVLEALVCETGATAIRWNRRYEPAAMRSDNVVKQYFEGSGVEVKSYNSHLLFEPWKVLNKQGSYFKVFTPFWRACRGMPVALPVEAPKRLCFASYKGASDSLDSWRLLPDKPDWAHGLRERWVPGEKSALAQLKGFLETELFSYKTRRDLPAVEGTSCLSPHLHFGEIGPRTVWQQAAVKAGEAKSEAEKASVECFLSELGWREFSYSLLYHYPALPEEPFQEKFLSFPWHDDQENYRAWCKGMTGYPIVDAGMRQLWECGWMHNRVRMIVASFLTKDLLIPWQLGAAWFLDTLVDADLANNSASWQWVAGCGADAAPYFRIFNPTLQGKKFDPDGEYIRRWVPELRVVANDHIHEPWKGEEAFTAGYPKPIVSHEAARVRALAAFAACD